MKKKILIIIMLVGIILLNLGIAQITNQIAKSELEGKGRVQVVGDLFILKFTQNPGAFFGMGGNLPEPVRLVILTIGPLVILLLMTGMIFIDKDTRLLGGLIKNINFTLSERIAMACIIGGGISNIGERIINGQVIDFMNFGIGPVFRTGILNFADLSITFGALVLIILMYIKDRKIKKLQKQQETAAAREKKAE